MLGRTGYQRLLVAAIVLAASVVGGVSATTSGTNMTGTGPNATASEASGNVTTPHNNPDEIRKAGDDQRVANYLATRLGGRLTESALAINAGEYERGRAPLDEEYGDLLSQYAAVASDLDEEALAERFNLTREQQRSVIETIEELEATRSEYEAAVAAGDEERRRELARELLAGAAELNQTAAELDQQYTALENNTEIDFETAQQAIEDAQARVGQAAVVIEEREFTATRLTAETNRTTVSVSKPATVSGRLTTANGTPVANGLIRLRMGADSVTTRTDRNGTFTTTYRPLLTAAAASNLTVTYEPAARDRYLPAVQTLPLSVGKQANTSVTLTATTETGAFDQPVRTNGTVQVAGAPERAIGGIPIVLTIDGRRLATAETEPDGGFAADGVLPANVPTGEAELEVAIDRRNAAIKRSAATESLTVQSTPTALSMNATADDEPNATVAGTLSTVEGTPLTSQTVTITVDGTETTQIATDDDGQFRETVALPNDVERGMGVALTVRFDGAGTNLESSTAAQQVTRSQPSGATGGAIADGATDTTALRPLVAVGLLFGGALLVIGRRSIQRWARQFGSWIGVVAEPVNGGGQAASGADDATATDTEPTESEEETTLETTPFDRARAALGAGQPDDAVRIAYAAMRSRLQPSDNTTAETHWEFYRRWQDEAAVDRTQLRTVTEAYETAAFAPTAVSSEAATAAVTASDELAEGQTRPED